jgi:hypothetical protein
MPLITGPRKMLRRARIFENTEKEIEASRKFIELAKRVGI